MQIMWLLIFLGTTYLLGTKVRFLEAQQQALTSIVLSQKSILEQFQSQLDAVEVADGIRNPRLGQLYALVRAVNKAVDTIGEALAAEREDRRKGELLLWQDVLRNNRGPGGETDGKTLIRAGDSR
jgi:hypothetical protein